MKVWVKTKLSDKANPSPENPNVPLLGGHETKIEQRIIKYSIIKPLSDATCIARLSGNKADIQPIIDDEATSDYTILTDAQVQTETRTKFVRDVSLLEMQRGNVKPEDTKPMPGREVWDVDRCDHFDKELEDMLTPIGEDYKEYERKHPNFKEREVAAVRAIAKKRDATITDDEENDILDGKTDGHNKATDKLRIIGDITKDGKVKIR